MLPAVVDATPELAAEAQEAISIARQHFANYISTQVNKAVRRIEELQRDECKRQLQAHRKHFTTATCDDTRKAFISSTQNSFVRNPDQWVSIIRLRRILLILSDAESL